MEVVAVDAMGFGRPRTTPVVLQMRHRLQMVWVHAQPNPTEMVELQTFWNWTNKPLVGKSMRKNFGLRSRSK
jgi:hypothetical protein